MLKWFRITVTVWIQALTAYTFIIIDSTHAIRNHQSINSIHRLAHLTVLLWTVSKRALEKNATCWNVSWAGATSPCPLNPSFSSLTSQSSVANSSKDQTESQQHQPIKNHIILIIFDKNSFLVFEDISPHSVSKNKSFWVFLAESCYKSNTLHLCRGPRRQLKALAVIVTQTWHSWGLIIQILMNAMHCVAPVVKFDHSIIVSPEA